MPQIQNKLNLLLLPFALFGFSVAQTIYNLLLDTPVFLLARQNTRMDVWMLVAFLSVIAPLVFATPAWVTRRLAPGFSSLWCWLISAGLASLFFAQLLQNSIGASWGLLIGLSVVSGLALCWVLLFTRWQMLIAILALLSTTFPIVFLYSSTVSGPIDSFTAVPTQRQGSTEDLPNIVFLILDELPLATLLDGDKQIDKILFPGFARLQSISTWYYDTTSVADGTGGSVPAILTGKYPGEEAAKLTVASEPVNLFTILGHLYHHNVAEMVTRMCPQQLCPRTGPATANRFKALLLDLSAIYLHRVSPDTWATKLPDVSTNWSGFFAERQVFFPDGWLKHTGEQTETNRPDYFRRFISSIKTADKPVLNFMHILFPHEPHGYFPNGENYGLEWMRGQIKQQWGDVEWGVISAKQRHYLQTQYVDRLINELLDRLQQLDMLDDTMIVVVSDHGINFAVNDIRRSLSGHNEAAMLRVPLFIKFAGQTTGVRITEPVMTIDIMPTMLAAIGIESRSSRFDGLDLQSFTLQPGRERMASSYRQRQLRVLDETAMDLSPLIESNRTQLHLDVEAEALWQIGPYDEFRGQAMASVCEKSAIKIEWHMDGFKALPNTPPNLLVRAFVSGIFVGDHVPDASSPFLITSNGIIVASGNSWFFNNHWLFFALVEPGYVKQENWLPEVWLLDGNQCLGR